MERLENSGVTRQTLNSTIFSFLLYEKNLSGIAFDYNINISTAKLHLALYVDSIASLTSSICGLIVFTIMILSYYLTERKKGYVSYFISLALIYGLTLSFVLSGDPFHRLF